MPVPPAPPPLEELGSVPFSFEPAIAGIEPNVWQYSGCSWSEVFLVNAETHAEIAVPRPFLGGMSFAGECVPVVTLIRRLECADGVARPTEHRLLVMPALQESGLKRPPATAPAAVVPIRLDDGRRPLARRLLVYAAAVGMAGTVLFAWLYRGEIIESRPAPRPPAQAARF